MNGDVAACKPGRSKKPSYTRECGKNKHAKEMAMKATDYHDPDVERWVGEGGSAVGVSVPSSCGPPLRRRLTHRSSAITGCTAARFRCWWCLHPDAPPAA